MAITARFLEGNEVIRVDWDGRMLDVPDDMANRDRRKLAEWEAKGGVIAPYVPPPEPTEEEIDADLMELIKTPGTFERAALEVLFDLATKPHDPDLTKPQFFGYFKRKLRS